MSILDIDHLIIMEWGENRPATAIIAMHSNQPSLYHITMDLRDQLLQYRVCESIQESDFDRNKCSVYK